MGKKWLSGPPFWLGKWKIFVGGGVPQSPQLGTNLSGKGRKKMKSMTAPLRLLATTDYIWYGYCFFILLTHRL